MNHMKRIFYFFVILFAITLLHYTYSFETAIGDADTLRFYLFAKQWHETGEINITGYKKISILYLWFVKSVLDYGIPFEKLSHFMNNLHILVGTLLLIPIHLFWTRIIGYSQSLLGLIFLSLTPGIWFLSLYSFPSLPAFLFAFTALLFFDYALQTERLSFRFYTLAVLSMMLACSIKADIILCGGTFLGLLFVRKRLHKIHILASLALPSLAILSPMLFGKFLSNIPQTDKPKLIYTVSDFYGMENIHLNSLLDIYHLIIPSHHLGPVITLAALIAFSYYLFYVRTNHGLLIFTTLTVMPQFLFWWVLKDFDFKHTVFGFSFLAFLLADFLFYKFQSIKTIAITTLILMGINYYSMPNPIIHDSFGRNTRIFSTANTLKKRYETLFSNAKEMALHEANRKVYFGRGSLQYAKYALQISYKNIRKEKSDQDQWHIITPDQKEQIIRFHYLTKAESEKQARTYREQGWQVYSLEYPL